VRLGCASGLEFAAGPAGERDGAHRGEKAERGLEVAPGICWALVPAQPLAEQQVRTCQVGCRGRAAENVDRLLVELASLVGRGHQSLVPGE